LYYRPFQFGIVITAWQLPFCLMIIDCLSVRLHSAVLLNRSYHLPSAPAVVPMQQQTPQAAWPHVLGIFSGHVFHFFTQVWPSLGGRAYLTPPKWVIDRLGGSAGSNIPGVDFRKTKAADRQQEGTEGSQPGSSLNRSKRHKGMFATKAKGRKL
jgi:hypothetical protein